MVGATPTRRDRARDGVSVTCVDLFTFFLDSTATDFLPSYRPRTPKITETVSPIPSVAVDLG